MDIIFLDGLQFSINAYNIQISSGIFQLIIREITIFFVWIEKTYQQLIFKNLC